MDLQITLIVGNKANSATGGVWGKGLVEAHPSDLGEALCGGVFCAFAPHRRVHAYAEHHRLLMIFWPLGRGTLAAHIVYLHSTRPVSVKHPFPAFLHIS